MLMENSASKNSRIPQIIQAAERGRARISQSIIEKYWCPSWWTSYQCSGFPGQRCDLEPLYERLLMGLPEQLTLITQKQQTMTQIRHDSCYSQRIMKRLFEKLPKRQYLPERWRMDIFNITNESVMDGNGSTILCREHSEPRNSQSSCLQAVLTDHVKIGPVTGTLVIEVQVPGQKKSWVRISRGIEQYAQQFIPTDTDHQRFCIPVVTTVVKLHPSQSIFRLDSVNENWK